jgi:alpha-tubulin suppressor-like RCC1 family protein
MGTNLPAVALPAGRSAVAIHAAPTGNGHTCAVLDDGSITCWGVNSSGQLGIGSTTAELTGNHATVALGTGRRATQIVSGSGHVCALLDDKTVKCWGYNASGQLGQGSTATLGDQPNELGDALPPITL